MEPHISNASIYVEQRLQQPSLSRVSDNFAHDSSIVSMHMLSHFHVALTHTLSPAWKHQNTLYIHPVLDGSVRTGAEVNILFSSSKLC